MALQGQAVPSVTKDFSVKGFHLDLRVQVLSFEALKALAKRLSGLGVNTLVMEWEASYPFEGHPLIPNRHAYTKAQVKEFIALCGKLGIDVIPLQQSFGHVDYILRHPRYQALREDPKDLSQVCPLQEDGNRELFTELFTELVKTHPSPYFHIGGDETYLLGRCPRCKAKVAKEGKSKLYVDHLKLLSDIVIKLGKRPVIWADIALKHPEALKELPKACVFVDWNYGWALDRFGDHQKLMRSGFEIWGAPALRSHPDNYFLTMWDKHFKNIRDFVSQSRELGYTGIVLTSWSTSGEYTYGRETSSDVIDLHAIRRVYPMAGFNMALAAYAASLRDAGPLNIDDFVLGYAIETYGLSRVAAQKLWDALKDSPYEVSLGKVEAPQAMRVQELSQHALASVVTLRSLRPKKNLAEFEHYRLMAEIRAQYLAYQVIESEANAEPLTKSKITKLIGRLRALEVQAKLLESRFAKAQRTYLHPSEIALENTLRGTKAKLLLERLARLR